LAAAAWAPSPTRGDPAAPAPWKATVVAEVGEKLGGIAVGELDDASPGLEAAFVSESGRVRVARAKDGAWSVVEAAHLPGEAIQVAVGDADAARPGLEIVAFGMEQGPEAAEGRGVATLVRREGGGWVHETIATRDALVHGGCVADLDPENPGHEVLLVGYDRKAAVASRGAGGWRTLGEVALGSEGKTAIPYGAGAVVACVGGTLEVVERKDGAWRTRVLATLPAGAARMARDGNKVLVACDDGALRLVDGANVTVLHQEGQKLRGAVFGEFDGDRPGLEAATGGYAGVVTLLRPGGPTPTQTLAEGAGRLHHLALFPLPDATRRHALLACGYSGRLLLLTPPDLAR
jgi:hypothetical protein